VLVETEAESRNGQSGNPAEGEPMETVILVMFFSAMLSLSGGLWSLSIDLAQAHKDRAAAGEHRT
jgi:hypothetical protein